jgi:pyrroline-5-carboxylate reductase
MKSLGIIGFGFMGEGIIQGLRKFQPELRINVVEKSAERRQAALSGCGATDYTDDLPGFFEASDLVILAIKPQDSADFLAKVEHFTKGSRIISILAGKPLSFFLERSLSTEVARFMPSLAASVGKSVTGVSFSEGSSVDFKLDAMAVAKAIGSAFEIPERLMPAVTGVSGSGIAFVFEFINALAMGGVRTGLPYATALNMGLDVLEGAVATLRDNKLHPTEMVSRVCSPAGSTVEGILELEQAGFQATVMKAVSRAADRSRELEQ